MSKLHRYRIPRWPHDARTAIFRWSPDFLTSDGDRQVPRQSPLDDLPIAVGASAEISVILKVNRAATEQSPGGGRQTSGAWLLRPGSRSKKSGDHLPMPQNRNRRKIGGSPHDSKSLWRRYYPVCMSGLLLNNLPAILAVCVAAVIFCIMFLSLLQNLISNNQFHSVSC